MRNAMRIFFFKILDKLLKKADYHTIEYYKYVSQGRLDVGYGMRFRRNSSIVFLDEGRDSRITFRDNCEIRQFCVFTALGKGKLSIDDDCFFNNGCSITALGEIKIGKNCLFGEGVRIYDHNHKYKEVIAIRDQGFSIGKVSIGNNCWFGSNCIILNNVTIGDNVVVGANTIVHKSIESNSIVRNNSDIISLVYR